MLAQHEFGARGGRDVEVDDGTHLFFAHHRQRSQHGGQHEQQQRDDGGHHGGQAAHIGVVAVAGFHLQQGRGGHAGAAAHRIDQPLLVHALHVAQHGLCALGHGAVHPGGNLHRLAPLYIARKTGRDLDGQRQLARSHAPVQLGVFDQRWALYKIARTRQVERIGAAGGRLVAVQHGKAQALHIHADAVAHHKHQQQRAQQGQGAAHRVTPQLQRLAPLRAVDAHQAVAQAGGPASTGWRSMQHGCCCSGCWRWRIAPLLC